MHTRFKEHTIFNFVFYLFSAIFLGAVIIKSPYAAGFSILSIFVFLFFAKNPLGALSLFVICVPYTEVALFTGYLVKIPGAKPLNILAVFVLLIAFLNYKEAVRMPRFGILFMTVFLGIFTISIIRSIPNLDFINAMQFEKFTISRYLLTEYLKPILYFMPFILILKLSKSVEDLKYLMQITAVSIVILSIYLLYQYIFKIPDKGSLTSIRDYYSMEIGLHRNDLANFFILGFPVVLATYFLKKNIFNIASICLSVAAVGFLYSRTAYVILIISFVLYLLISKRTKYFPIILTIAFGLSFIISSSIIERASKGLDSLDWNEISAGRVEHIWIPLAHEYSAQPLKLLFGDGRYSILATNVAAKGEILSVSHPHNMYFEVILDVGLIGLIIILTLSIYLLLKLYKNFKVTKNIILKEYQYAVFVSIISYLIAGLTGRYLLPTIANAYLWLIVSFAILILKLNEHGAEIVDAEA